MLPRLAARTALAILDATLILTLVGGVYEATLPGVANAPILTAKILRAQ